MAVGIFEGKRAGYEDGQGTNGAFLFCTVTEWAFGPLFDSADDCKEFLEWLERARPGVDARRIEATDLQQLQAAWLVETRRRA